VFRRVVRRKLHTLLVCSATSLVAFALPAIIVPAAHAHDSLAPRGLDQHPWLPREHWVHHHWLPYDEARLQELLAADTATIFGWLRNDHRTIAGLARRRGVDPRTLTRRLLAGRRNHVSPGVYARLRQRTQRMLTQGHLAQHVYFHVFHGPRIVSRFRRRLGVSAARYRQLRYTRGLSIRQIARRHGRDPAVLHRHARAALRAVAAEGVAHRETSRRQADAMLARQERLLGCWVDRPAPKFDPAHPFGQPNGGHGRHHRGSRVGLKHPKPARGCWRGLYTG
jgi:hypothetical protein